MATPSVSPAKISDHREDFYMEQSEPLVSLTIWIFRTLLFWGIYFYVSGNPSYNFTIWPVDDPLLPDKAQETLDLICRNTRDG